MAFYDDDYDTKIRKLWDMGALTEEQLWRQTTAEQRDRIVLDQLASGSLSVDDEAYHNYYNHRERYRGRWDPLESSPETRARFPWMVDDQDDFE